MDTYENQALAFKALCDPNRLRIVNMLSCQELSTNRILEQFEITQPTLFHHMKILCDVGLVVARKDCKMTYYKLSVDRVEEFGHFISQILSCPESCPEKNAKCNCEIKRCTSYEQTQETGGIQMNTITLKIEGMHCNGCALGLEGALEDLSFVKTAEVDFESATAILTIDGEADMALIEKTVQDTGFSVAK